ncbi:MAG TPA: DUF3606 domain-containing protein [Pseudolabrys sp.]|nr:DUF3606 domain-containing protein [Pseudolabrys sp.]
MADDRASADLRRINTKNQYEVRYWSERLGVSDDDILSAVRRVGPVAEDVERELAKLQAL